MIIKLKNLCQYYAKNKGKYVYSNIKINEYFEIIKGNYAVNIKSISCDNNKILLFISEKNKLIYKGLIYESNEDVSAKFNLIKTDLINLNLDNFIEKYYDILK